MENNTKRRTNMAKFSLTGHEHYYDILNIY